ncbi:hypothetical protein N0V93_003874 [Gnomoniopsis smithogilvyi]|uniref:C2H2-type domain-containing protein n=1 Tax=Gnomoniopsis smithogilvyi TaxID=1191159 RepID=A0A9W8Z1M0_9PEZI|nr:hypothetical protein N0V93_003874 [Gnomoniopsis smithogilvyi]
MAPDDLPVAIASPLPASTTAPPPAASTVSVLPRSASPQQISVEKLPSPSNKRPREDSPISPTSITSNHSNRDYSPTKVARLSLAAQLSPPLQLTGVAALREERRRREEEERRNPPGVSENPTHKALSTLMSANTLAVSRPQDAPSNMDEIGALAAEATKALGPVTVPRPNVSDARADISPPPSASSTAGAADLQAVMNSPGPMDVDQRDDRQSYTSQPDAHMEDKAATSFSYPGILAPGSGTPAPAPPPRPSSLPRNGEHTPSSSKKHKCPYCDTEFTRHHNLKSHLLTHSQEKPYLCQECKLRFRRLHDLKRHGKLHTGEKNHECPKCGRKFARGDALARHNKGAGGCAGRRASMGSYDDGGEYDGPSRNEGDDSAMGGVVYEGNGDVDLTEEDRRRLSLPAIKAHHVASSSDVLTPNSRSYPPASRPGAPAVLYPPNVDRSNNVAASSSLANNIAGGHPSNPSHSSHLNSYDSSLSLSNNNRSSLLHLQGITESPKPLSPVVHDQARQRSPTLATSYQQPPQYTRRPSDRDLHPLPPLPPPHGTTHPLTRHPIRAKQETDQVQGHGAPGLAANPSAHSRAASGPNNHAGSGDSSANLFAQGDQGVWAYIQQLEQSVKHLNDRLATVENVSNEREARLASVETTLAQRETKIGFLELELAGLRKDVGNRQQQSEETRQTA